MSHKPVVGQIGRADRNEIQKVEIIGELRPPEWALFIACLRNCVSKFRGKIKIKRQQFNVKLTSFPPKTKGR